MQKLHSAGAAVEVVV